MEIVRGEVYLDGKHVFLLRNEEEYVKKRYHAVARTLADQPVRILRKEAAEFIGRSKRQLQRIAKRFLEEGIPGLRFKSKAPHSPPKNKTPFEIERRVIEVRKATGFGSVQLAAIVNESLNVDRRNRKRITDALIQSDLTSFNGFPIMTMEDDHSRRSWAERLNGPATDDLVIHSMESLHPDGYENLLTDNGKQFARNNSTMRKYCEEYLTGKHIWSSVHHPQTLGKLSNFQKGLKAFLRHRLGRSRDTSAIDECIEIYLSWYNNGKRISTTCSFPEERYSGRRDPEWYQRFVKALKLDRILPVSVMSGG